MSIVNFDDSYNVTSEMRNRAEAVDARLAKFLTSDMRSWDGNGGASAMIEKHSVSPLPGVATPDSYAAYEDEHVTIHINGVHSQSAPYAAKTSALLGQIVGAAKALGDDEANTYAPKPFEPVRVSISLTGLENALSVLERQRGAEFLRVPPTKRNPLVSDGTGMSRGVQES